jgi:hypothetical protein
VSDNSLDIHIIDGIGEFTSQRAAFTIIDKNTISDDNNIYRKR